MQAHTWVEDFLLRPGFSFEKCNAWKNRKVVENGFEDYYDSNYDLD